MLRSACCLLALVLLGACVAPGRAMMVRDDGNLGAYPADFHTCKREADRVYDPANPFLAPGRYDSICACLMAKGYTYQPRSR
jgi:hypothetical protein